MNATRYLAPTLLGLAVALAAVPISVSTATAQARPSTKSYTCEGLKRFVRQRGAVVMSHRAPHLYQRFVANDRFCDYDEAALPFRVPTKTGSCSLKTCQIYERLLFDRD